jgi:hypothetical protein
VDIVSEKIISIIEGFGFVSANLGYFLDEVKQPFEIIDKVAIRAYLENWKKSFATDIYSLRKSLNSRHFSAFGYGSSS